MDLRKKILVKALPKCSKTCRDSGCRDQSVVNARADGIRILRASAEWDGTLQSY